MGDFIQKRSNKIIVIIFLFGLILRIAFAVSFELPRFSYDIGIDNNFNKNNYQHYSEILNLDYDGCLQEGEQLDYIMRIYAKGELPDSADKQFYHPPLSHFGYAMFMKIVGIFTDNAKILLESLEFLSIIYSMITILVFYKILKEIGISDDKIVLPILLITFHPLSIWMSRLVNTDTLVTLFIMLSILYLIKYYKNPCYKNSIILATFVGFGAMSKISAFVMMLPIFIVFLVKLVKASKDSKEFIKITLQGLVFILISLPLGLWWTVRNFYKFGQSFFSIANPLDSLAIADNSFVARWIPNHELFVKSIEDNASNVWSALIISTINFAEDFCIDYKLSIILRVLSIILIAFSFISILKCMIDKDNRILIITYFSWILSYISFNLSMPYSCSMHSRYMASAIYLGIIFIGIIYNKTNNKIINKLLECSSILFVLLSIILFVKII